MFKNKLFNTIFGNILRGDKVIWFIFLFLCGISILVVFSATSTIAYKRADHWGVLMSHVFKLIIGVVVVMAMQQIPPKYFIFSVIGVPVAAILLLYTSFKGISANDASRWIDMGVFQFQPSEFAKLMLICSLAFGLSIMNEKNVKSIYLIILVSLSVICLLIFKDNFSTAILLAFVCFVVMWIAQVPAKYLLSTIGVVIIVAILFFALALLWENYKGEEFGRVKTWQARIERFFDESNNISADTYEITDSNRQITHANIAIAQGGIGGLPGSGNQRDYLPQAYSDFIFAIILEETGLIGGIIVLLLYLLFVFRCGIIAKKTDNKYYKYLIIGSSLIIVVQAMTNIAVAVGIIPVTGQPLPLLSRGGTSLIITCAYFGIILSCSSKKNEDKAISESKEDTGIVEDQIN